MMEFIHRCQMLARQQEDGVKLSTVARGEQAMPLELGVSSLPPPHDACQNDLLHSLDGLLVGGTFLAIKLSSIIYFESQ